MFTRTLFTVAAVALIALTGGALRAEEETTARFQRVFVFDSKAKPAEALESGRFMCRLIDKNHPMLLSTECEAKLGLAHGLGTRALTQDRAESQAFICPHCGRLIWQDTGRDVKLTQCEPLTEKDLEAIVKITTQLVQSK